MSGHSELRVDQLEKRVAELTVALEQLRASEERWRTIVSTDPECVKTISLDGYLIEMNPAGLAMLSASSLEQVKGRPLLDWIAPEYQEAFRDLHRRVIQGENGELEFEVIGITGARRWLRTQAAPLRDRTGAITSVLGISRDITGQRELEAQLRHSQKMEAIGQLAGGIAHDFNNILTIIMGFATTLLEDDDPATRRVATTQIVNAADRAAGLTRQLLAFGRRQIMKPQDEDLNDLVSSLAKMVQRLLGEDINLQLQLSMRPLPIYADRGLIDQVLMNLVINARDAMPSGGVLRIETAMRSSGTGDQAVVRVIDTGTGIPVASLPRIFDPFYTTKAAGKGSGLGLATAFGIVAQHNGRIEVSSEIGRGTTFEVTLPATTPIAARPQTTVGGAARTTGGSETILVVEDEPAVRLLTRTILERGGYRVIEAASGTDGLRAWEQSGRRVDLLLTDVVMPDGMSGWELAERLQSACADLSVVLTSGYSTDLAGRELSLKQRQSFLQKPAKPKAILEAVRRALDQP
ncbi:MAG: hybrid sensor histidine kinase/response regulator [Vicinamibacterales bacterium]